MSHKPAGGLKSRNVVSKPVKTGVDAKSVDKNWPAQVGGSRGDHITGKNKMLGDHRAEPYKGASFNPVKQGNEIAAATICKPGGSGTVMRGGQQAQYGSVAGARRPQGRGILNNE